VNMTAHVMSSTSPFLNSAGPGKYILSVFASLLPSLLDSLRLFGNL
jgi:hypothetical protein